MGEWLFDTPIFRATMTAEMEREANLFRNEFRNESKEDTTMTKTAAKTAKTTAKTAEKETTMNNEPKKRLTREEWKAQYIADLTAKANELAAKHEGDELPIPINLYHKLNNERTGAPVKGLYASELEMRVLALTCLENGWEAEYMTANQAGDYSGKPKDDAVGIKLHGKNVAKGYTFYNVSEIEWEFGEPVWNEDVANERQATYAQYAAERKVRNAKRAVSHAKKNLKDAAAAAGIPAKPKRRVSKAKATSTKAAAPSGDMAEMVNALLAQNAQLMEALTAAIAK